MKQVCRQMGTGPAALLVISGLAIVPMHAEVRVSTGEALKAAVRKPNPEYSSVARQMRVTGDVEVEVKINDKGEVDDVKVVTGNAMLTANVVRTVKDWKFTPFSEGGKPAPAVTALRFSFKQ